MLYLIKDRDYLKIGYTSNLDQRKKAYETTNCYAEIIMVRDGTMRDEKTLHELCKQWHYKNEWFHYNEEIIKIFEEYQPDLENRLIELESKMTKVNDKLEHLLKEFEIVSALVINHEQTLDQWYSEYKKYEKSCSDILDNADLKSTLHK